MESIRTPRFPTALPRRGLIVDYLGYVNVQFTVLFAHKRLVDNHSNTRTLIVS